MSVCVDLQGNHAVPSDDSDLKESLFEFVLLTCTESKNREMQGNDDFQPFFGLITCTVARLQLRKEHESRESRHSKRC